MMGNKRKGDESQENESLSIQSKFKRFRVSSEKVKENQNQINDQQVAAQGLEHENQLPKIDNQQHPNIDNQQHPNIDNQQHPNIDTRQRHSPVDADADAGPSYASNTTYPGPNYYTGPSNYSNTYTGPSNYSNTYTGPTLHYAPSDPVQDPSADHYAYNADLGSIVQQRRRERERQIAEENLEYYRKNNQLLGQRFQSQ